MRRFPAVQRSAGPPCIQSAARRLQVRNRAATDSSHSPRHVNLPENATDLAFYSVGNWRRSSKPGRSLPKTHRFYLDRLKRYGPKLECVITLTESLA